MLRGCISQQLWRSPANSWMKKSPVNRKMRPKKKWACFPLLLWLFKDYWGTLWRQRRRGGHITHVITTYKWWTAQNDKWQFFHSEWKKENLEGVFSVQWNNVIAQHLKKKQPLVIHLGYSTQTEGRGCTLLPWKQKSFLLFWNQWPPNSVISNNN